MVLNGQTYLYNNVVGDKMRLSDLQAKDVKIEAGTGKMQGLVLEEGKMFRRFFNNKEEYEIVWDQIIKIGEDVILVKVDV